MASRWPRRRCGRAGPSQPADDRVDRIEGAEVEQSSGERSGAAGDVWVIEAVREPYLYWRVDAQPGRMETGCRDSNVT
jgi:hypothetical protein